MAWKNLSNFGFKKYGNNVLIDELAVFINPGVIEIGDNVRIDAFTKIIGGVRVIIGDYVHIASFCMIFGGGECYIDNFSTLAPGVKVITGTDDYMGNGMTNPTVPLKYKPGLRIGKVNISKHVIIGTNSVVDIGTVLQEGVAVGALSFVRGMTIPWRLYIGNPARPVRVRWDKTILEYEKKLMAESQGGK